MARGVTIDFNANLTRFTTAVDKASNQLNRFESNTKRVSRNIRNLLGGVTLGIGVAEVVQATVTEIAKLEKTLSGVRAVTGATDAEMKALTRTARELGAKTQFSATQAAEGIEFLGRAGFETNEIIEAMPGLLDLAAAAAIDLGRASDIASNVLSGFGLEAENITQVADVLAATSASANTNVEQLGEAFKLVAPIAASLGQSIEETSAAIGILGNSGIQGTRAGTALRGALAALANPAKKAQSAIQSLGLTVQELDPATNSLNEIFERLALAGLDTASAFEIFGREAAPAVLALTRNSDDLREFVERLRDAEGTAADMAAVLSDNLTGDARELGSALAELAQKVGDAGLTSVLRGATQALTGLARGIGELVEGPDLETVLKQLDAIDSGRDSQRGRSAPATRGFRRRELAERRDELAISRTSGPELLRKELELIEDELNRGNKRIRELTAEREAIPEEERERARGRGGAAIGRRTRFEDLNAEITVATSELEEIAQKRQKVFDALADIELQFEESAAVSPIDDLLDPPKGDSKDSKVSTAKSQIDEFLRSFERLEDTLDPAGAAIDQLNERIQILVTAREKAIITDERYIELVQALTDEYTKQTSATKKQADADNELAKNRDRALDIISRFDPVSDLRDQLIEVQNLRDAFGELEPAIADALGEVEFYIQEKIGDKFEEAAEQGEEAADQIGKAWESLGPVFESAFEDALVEGEKLSDVLKALEKDIIRVLARQLIIKPIIGGIQGGLDELGGGGTGGAGFFDFFRARGGPVSAGKTYMVGERGPELFRPGSSGSIIPNGAGNTYNFSFALPSDSVDNRRAGQQIAREAARYMSLSQAAT